MLYPLSHGRVKMDYSAFAILRPSKPLMIALLQRTIEARVDIGGRTVAAIDSGVLALVGFHKDDSPAQIGRMAERILGYRLFADEEGKMNRSLVDTGGALLLVPQFTLAADTDRGMRASFSSAAPPEAGRMLFESLCEECREQHGQVETGEFGADMQVRLINDGPVTFVLTL